MPSTATDRLNGLTTSVAVKGPCRVAALTNITLAGEQTVNGVAVVEGDRVLVTAQTSSTDNGIYKVSTGDWTRALDFDGNRDVVQGTIVPVVDGAGTEDLYTVTSANPITIDTTALTFSLRYGANVRYDRTAAEISAGVTPTDYAYPSGDIRRYGGVGDDATDCSTALSNALAVNSNTGPAALVPDGIFQITDVTMPDNTHIYGHGLKHALKKRANGDMLNMGRNCSIDGVFLDGNGSTYTGRGIEIPYTAEFEGYQQIRDCRIYDTESYCVEYSSGAAGSGFGSKIVNCDLRVTGNVVPAIKWGADPTNEHGNRSILNCTAGSGALVDCSTADNGFIIGNTIGDDASTAGIIMGADSAKLIIMGNRIASTTAMTIQGQQHTFIGNICACDVTIAAATTGCRIRGNVIAGTFTDSSGGGQNEIDTQPTTYAVSWTGSTGNPAVGDGTLEGYFTRSGRLVTITIDLTIGSTTTFGSGDWRLSLPSGVSTSQPAWGTVFMNDADGTPVIGTFYVAASATYGVIYMQGTAGLVAPAAPFTWADGDFMRVTCTYISG